MDDRSVNSKVPLTAEGLGKPIQAALVVHGIGQQRPFEVLDSFARGLIQVLDEINDADPTGITHVKSTTNQEFDHFIRLQTSKFSVDVYEYYWAPMTQGKASFGAVLGWLRVTALTPVRRLAFNIPLILQRSQSGSKVAYQLVRELWRIIYIPLLALTIAALAAMLVKNSADFLKTLVAHVRGPVETALSAEPQALWANVVTLLVFFGLLIGLAGLALSLPEQIRDFYRLKAKLKDRKPGIFQTFAVAYRHSPGNLLDRLENAGGLAAKTVKKEEQWTIEIRSRRLLLLFTVLGLILLSLSVRSLWAGTVVTVQGAPILTPIVHQLFESMGRQPLKPLLVSLVLLLLAGLMKRIFVDYLGDVALYVTADENSAFFATRTNILTEATRRLRWLLRNYEKVDVAGHSLGSVIVYDAISWLRIETQVAGPAIPNAQLTQATDPIGVDLFRRLHSLITFGSPLNKVVYFFRTKVPAYDTIRAHILNELHGFRRPPELLTADPTIQDFPLFRPPDNLHWLNVYSPTDPISARLDYFQDVENYWRWYWIWGFAHLSYWHDKKFYQRVARVMGAIP